MTARLFDVDEQADTCPCGHADRYHGPRLGCFHPVGDPLEGERCPCRPTPAPHPPEAP